MINLTMKQAMQIIHNQDGIVSEQIYEPELLFYKKYLPLKDKIVSMGEIDGIVKTLKYFEKAEKPYGLVIYLLPYELKLVKRKVDKSI